VVVGNEDLSPGEVLRHWLERQGLDTEIVETHTSVLAMTTDRVFKMKKPVRFAFVDLSTPQLRLRVCERELRLNRRLAPDVYLGIVDVTDDMGRTVDHAVQMVRLPDDRRLDALLAAGGGRSCLHALAGLMAQFHGSAATSPEIAAAGTAEAVHQLWRAGIDQMEQFPQDLIDLQSVAELERLSTRYLEGRAPLFAQRVEDGRIRDGHGDLRTDDVFCLADGLRVLDCLEFDDRLRWGDVLADVAFLAMDLEWLGHAAFARHFLDEYRRTTGDDWPASLEHHWIGYRSQVRAKVACLRAVAGIPGAEAHARGHMELSLRHLRDAQVRLILLGGLPGTGKTTLGRALCAGGRGPVLVRSDVVRKEMAGIATDARRPDRFAQGLYAPAATEAVYEQLLQRASQLLRRGYSVVLDASWSNARHRAAAADVASAGAADLAALRCWAPATVTEARIAARLRGGGDASDADVAVARAMAARADRWPEATPVDTDADLAVVTRRAQEAMGIFG
jgi:uncharacterized protein